jgi:hypothetical protein
LFSAPVSVGFSLRRIPRRPVALASPTFDSLRAFLGELPARDPGGDNRRSSNRISNAQINRAERVEQRIFEALPELRYPLESSNQKSKTPIKPARNAQNCGHAATPQGENPGFCHENLCSLSTN